MATNIRPPPMPPDDPFLGVLFEKIKDGELTEADVDWLMQKWKVASWSKTEKPYKERMGDALFTVEWFRSMRRMLDGRRVIEIGKVPYPHIILNMVVNYGGDDFNWSRIPADPRIGRYFVPGKNFPVVFAHRIREPERALLKFVKDERLPLVLVRDLHKTDILHPTSAFRTWNVAQAKDAFPWFEDVPNFPKWENKTWIVLPPGTAIICEGRAVAGPPLKETPI